MFTNLTIDNHFVESLPGDRDSKNHIRLVRNACYSIVTPTVVARPQLIAVWSDVAELLNLTPEFCASNEFTQLVAGNRLLPSMKPYSMCYGGHQFGTWAGQLGDGRAITLGELKGRDGCSYALQLKGAGTTPYSRNADGLAVLRSSIREFICSEAMHHLGVPTTRALSLITTGETVVRDMLYDGNPQEEPGAIVGRVSPTFVRFGNFEIFAAQQNVDILRQLADYTITEHFPHLLPLGLKHRYVRWFEEVVSATANVVSEWKRVGFVHGVMNTDNMSITGLTIDYGPYGWVENYDLNWTPNTTDAVSKRYTFGAQPKVAHWNLLQLANAIYSLIGEPTPLQHALNEFPKIYQDCERRNLANKLGLLDLKSDDDDFLAEMERVLTATETDMTLFFRGLSSLPISDEDYNEDLVAHLSDAFYHPQEVQGVLRQRLNRWLRSLVKRICRDQIDLVRRRKRMNTVNPLYVPRNYLAQLVIEAAETEDYSLLHEWMDVLQHPYDEQENKGKFAEKRPEWARTRVGCSMLSCSS